ncbi:sulfur carrier protein ThiS [Profundibacterium mesophilum]|uniref:Thiamine biosynthesis protein ThiG n=1 Tax=Profundibacterium mesophilum KAUST100406-0324 TaxID=1037889 RepID=A0A921NQ10_9RHOB|nr:sulfur carrier protein ThiS [Profundibacterium mesophilum]KAF0675155.1 thiamine biosynthesis protein ThiG [Profundibacterium mesophilum KAUST100406-0324]
MKITVNGAPAELGASRLDAALVELGYGEAKIATALNERFVPATARPQTTLSEGDRLEIVSPRQGG